MKHRRPWVGIIRLRKGDPADCLSVEESRALHHVVYRRAARNIHEELRTAEKVVLGVKLTLKRSPLSEKEAF